MKRLFGAQLIGAFLFTACLLLQAWAGPFSLVGYPWTVIQTNKQTKTHYTNTHTHNAQAYL